METVIVVDYDPAWPAVFDALRVAIRAALGHLAASIEHVGSTSVPGLAAKPVIDLDVVVAGADVATAIARLAHVGYVHRGDLGIVGREAFWSPAGSPAHHLYVCPADSVALANHLAVRDHLRAHPEAARAYGELKKRLARLHARDIDGYVEGKSAFLLGILRSSGFDSAALGAIERANRRPGTDGG